MGEKVEQRQGEVCLDRGRTLSLPPFLPLVSALLCQELQEAAGAVIVWTEEVGRTVVGWRRAC